MKPDVQNEPYGPHERNRFGLWLAEAGRPAPLMLYIHGGGFKGGDKSSVNEKLLRGCLHHPNFGRHLEPAMKRVGVECVRRMYGDYSKLGGSFEEECVTFLKRHLGTEK